MQCSKLDQSCLGLINGWHYPTWASQLAEAWKLSLTTLFVHTSWQRKITRHNTMRKNQPTACAVVVEERVHTAACLSSANWILRAAFTAGITPRSKTLLWHCKAMTHSCAQSAVKLRKSSQSQHLPHSDKGRYAIEILNLLDLPAVNFWFIKRARITKTHSY